MCFTMLPLKYSITDLDILPMLEVYFTSYARMSSQFLFAYFFSVWHFPVLFYAFFAIFVLVTFDVVSTLFPETYAIARSCGGTHAIKFACAIYCMHEIKVFSFFVLVL